MTLHELTTQLKARVWAKSCTNTLIILSILGCEIAAFFLMVRLDTENNKVVLDQVTMLLFYVVSAHLSYWLLSISPDPRRNVKQEKEIAEVYLRGYNLPFGWDDMTDNQRCLLLEKIQKERPAWVHAPLDMIVSGCSSITIA